MTENRTVDELLKQFNLEEVLTDPEVTVVPQDGEELVDALWRETKAVEDAMKALKNRGETLRGMLKGTIEPGDTALVFSDGRKVATMTYPEPTKRANVEHLHEHHEDDPNYWIVTESTPRMTLKAYEEKKDA